VNFIVLLKVENYLDKYSKKLLSQLSSVLQSQKDWNSHVSETILFFSILLLNIKKIII